MIERKMTESRLLSRILEDWHCAKTYKKLIVLDKVNITFYNEADEYIEYSVSAEFFNKYLLNIIH